MDYADAIKYLKEHDIKKDDGTYYEYGEVSWNMRAQCLNHTISVWKDFEFEFWLGSQKSQMNMIENKLTPQLYCLKSHLFSQCQIQEISKCFSKYLT